MSIFRSNEYYLDNHREFILMETPTDNELPQYNYLQKAFQYAKDYFTTAEDRYIAWLLLIGAVISVIAFVALLSVMSWWTVGFWAALSASSLPLFIASMETFALIVSGLVAVSVLRNYLVETLSIRWRNWLTNKLVNDYLSSDENNYLDLSRHASQIDNPGQRIQSDVQIFVSQTLSLSLDFLNAVLTQISFIGTLWVVGGALSFVLLGVSITIPGYLVWVALLFSAVASYITYRIGRFLVDLNRQQESLEADFRKDIDLLNDESENIAQEKGEHYYQESLASQSNDISQNSITILGVRINLTMFKGFYQQIAAILPYIAAAPLYFMGQTTLGQLMQIGFAFAQVQASFDWFINSYEWLASYKASLDRLIELEHALGKNSLVSTKKNIVVQHKDTNTLVVNDLNIAYPSSTGFMMRHLNISFKFGENTLIKGPSGLGKSTLFKVMAGTWTYGDGEVIVSDDHKMCFLPQKPTLPNDTLKAVLAYPDPVETYTEEQYIAVLTAVGNIDHLIDELETKTAWSKRLSPGQQQRIAFARVLLKKPDWLFLDEATSSLDPEGEQHLYELIKNELKNTTFISIAHRPTVGKFHERIINFTSNEDHVIDIKEERDNETDLSAANDDASSIDETRHSFTSLR